VPLEELDPDVVFVSVVGLVVPPRSELVDAGVAVPVPLPLSLEAPELEPELVFEFELEARESVR
jgi:hypothetical protein